MAITINVGKVKAFRGKQIEDMKNLDVREFAKYLNSRETRLNHIGFDASQDGWL